MMTTFRQWVKPPVFAEDEDTSRAATLLNIVLWIFIIGSLMYGLFAPVVPEMRIRRAAIIIPFILILLVLKQVLNRKYVRPVATLVVFTLWLMFTGAMFFGADYNNPAFMGYLVVVNCAGLILNWRAAIGWSFFSILTNAVILLLGQNNILPHSHGALPPVTFWMAQTVYIVISTILLSQALRKIDESVAKARQSEDRYRAVVENQTEFIVRWKPDGTRTFVNDAYCRYFGLAPEQATSTSFIPLIVESDRLAMQERISRLLSGTINTETYIQQVIKPDGSVGWQEWTDRTIRDATDHVIEFQSVGRDITERKQAEMALREAEQKYRAIFENANEGIFQITPDGEYLTANPAAARILGYDSPEELRQAVPNVVAIYVDPTRRAEFRKELETQGETRDFEAQVYRKDGERIWVSLNAHATRDANGNVLYFEGFAQDITERKLSEMALRQSEERFRKVFHFNPVAIGITTLEEGKLLEANYAYWELTGYDPETSIGRNAEELKMRVEPEEHIRLVQNLRQMGSMFNPNDYFFHTNGSIRYVISFYELIQIDQQDCMLVIFYDVTERKQAEADLQRYAKRMEILHEIDRSLLSTRSSQEIARGALGRIRQLVPCLRASVSLFDFANSHVLFLAADFDGLQTIPDTPMSLDEFGSAVIDMLRQDKPWFTNDMLQESQVTDMDKRLANEYGIHAWLSLPLLSQGQLIGALNLGRGTGQPFTSEEAELAREVADQIAIVIQQNQLFDATQRQVREQKLAEEKLRQQAEQMSALYDIGLTITSNFELDQIRHDLFEKCRQLLPIDTFYIAVYDEATRVIQHPLFYDGSQKTFIQMDDRNIETAPGLSGYVILSKTTLYLPNSNDPVIQEKYKIVRSTSVSADSYVGVPMLVHGTIVGVISMQNFEPDAYSPKQIRLLETIATQAAVAIENARLYQTEQKRRQEAETLRQAATAISSTLDADMVVREVLAALKRLIPYDSVSVFFHENNQLRIAITEGYPHAEAMKDQTFSDDDEFFQIVKATGQPIVVKDAQKDSRFKRWGDSSSVRGWMVVPLISRGQVIGAITFDSLQPDVFDENTGHTAMSFAYHAASAIENASLYTEIQQELAERKRAEESLRTNEEKIRELNVSLEKRVEERTEQLQAEKARIERIANEIATLRRLSDFLQASLTIEEACQIIASHMNTLFFRTSGALYLTGDNFSDLSLMTNWGDISAEPVIQPDACWGMRRGRVFVRHPSDASPACAHFGTEDVEESMCLPLLAQNETIGMLCMQALSSEERYFTTDVQDLAVASADSIGLALANLRLRERLRNQSIRDPLTGLFNRRYLEETLARETHRASRSQSPLCVIMFEVDNFKHYNNTFGHDAGDYVLRKVADTMRVNLRRSDFPCRYGGDEFTLLLTETTLEDGAHRAEGLRKAVEALTLSFNNQALGQVTVRMGVAAYPRHGETGEIVLKAADDASYQARSIGKNCVVVAE